MNPYSSMRSRKSTIARPVASTCAPVSVVAQDVEETLEGATSVRSVGVDLARGEARVVAIEPTGERPAHKRHEISELRCGMRL